jgi:hypothetical protein
MNQSNEALNMKKKSGVSVSTAAMIPKSLQDAIANGVVDIEKLRQFKKEAEAKEKEAMETPVAKE